MAKFIKIFCLAGFGILLLCLFSCEQKQEPVKAKKQTMKVSKSIPQARNTKPKPSGKATAAKKDTQPQGVVKVEKPSIPGSKGDGSLPPALVTKPLPAKSTLENSHQPDIKGNAKTGIASTEKQSLPVLNNKKYDTKGRIDPFVPLFTEKKEESVSSAKAEPEDDKKPKRILTPLEKIDLSQIKLVAVFEVKGQPAAMVEQANGKGYEVKVGTYIGRKSGQVSAINKSGIVVKEYVKDFKGNRRERIQEIKFHRDEGGD